MWEKLRKWRRLFQWLLWCQMLRLCYMNAVTLTAEHCPWTTDAVGPDALPAFGAIELVVRPLAVDQSVAAKSSVRRHRR